MTQYRITTHGGQHWFCDAGDPDAAKQAFRNNVADIGNAELATLVEIGAPGKSLPVTVHQPKKRRASR
jgi:hypothetical protein